MVLVWWPLPECSWRLEGASSWCWFDGHCRSVHGDWKGRLVGSLLVVIAGVYGGWRGPRVGAGLVATAEVFMEAGGVLELVLV